MSWIQLDELKDHPDWFAWSERSYGGSDERLRAVRLDDIASWVRASDGLRIYLKTDAEGQKEVFLTTTLTLSATDGRRLLTKLLLLGQQQAAAED